jgi:hypothetical protein
MRFVTKLMIVITLCFIIIALLPMPTQARCRYPDIRLSSNEGVPGDSVTIYGSDFDPEEYVAVSLYLNTALTTPIKEDILPDRDGNFQFSFTIPETPAGRYKVLAEGNNDLEEVTFTVRPGVRVNPQSGPGGTPITVSGRGFAAHETGIEVRRGLYETLAKNIEADRNGSWEMSFEVPSWTRGEHEIRARGSVNAFVQGVRPAIFEVKPGISISQPSGGVGQSVAVSASGFAAGERNIRILLHGEPVATGISADDSGRWQASFTVPDMSQGEYALTAAGDSTRERDVGEVTFAVGPGLMLSPDHGHVGMNVTAMGRGFAASRNVVVIYDGTKVATATTDAEGRFDVTLAVPQGRNGERTVAVAIAEGTNNIADLEIAAMAFFTVESDPPPTPEPLSPVDGERVGFVRKVRPTFQWSGVSDPSGVSYSIQIATSPDFDPSSVLVSLKGLTGTSYTLASDPLPYGTYYWTVQAMDGAENEGGWAEVQSFRAGRLPLWAFIVIIVFVAVILIARLRILLIRRLYYY